MDATENSVEWKFGLGSALSADGKVLAVGCHQLTGMPAATRGYVDLFGRSDDGWAFLHRLPSRRNSDLDPFGLALSEDGSVVAVETRYHQDERSLRFFKGQRAVEVFKKSGGAWESAAVLTSDEPSVSKDAIDAVKFGQSLALDRAGTKLLVAESGYLPEGRAIQGGIHVFDLVEGEWVHATVITSPGGQHGHLGFSFDLSSDGRVVVAQVASVNTEIDRIYLPEGLDTFTLDEAGNWTHQDFTTFGMELDAFWGLNAALAISGDGETLVTACEPCDDLAGEVLIYKNRGTMGWTLVGRISGSDIKMPEPAGFGSRLALTHDGSTLVVGAEAEYEFGDESPGLGSFEVIDKTNPEWDSWRHRCSVPVTYLREFSGWSMSASANSDQVAISLAEGGADSPEPEGRVSVFTLEGTTWRESKLSPEPPEIEKLEPVDFEPMPSTEWVDEDLPAVVEGSDAVPNAMPSNSRFYVGLFARAVAWLMVFLIVGNAMASSSLIGAITALALTPITFFLWPFLAPDTASAWPLSDSSGLIVFFVIGMVSYAVSTLYGRLPPQ